MAAVFFSLMVGLAATAALGLAMVGSFNLISIAFFVLFVGLGVDFGIQFSVRYRTERHEHRRSCARLCEVPPARREIPSRWQPPPPRWGSSRSCPPDYRGLSELGLIAGCGMLIAFFCSITLVPAMLALLNPPGEAAAVGFQSLAPLDRFPAAASHRGDRRHDPDRAGRARRCLLHLPFDFNPVNLAKPDVRPRSSPIVNCREIRKPAATMPRYWRRRSNRPMPSPGAWQRSPKSHGF